MSKKVSEKYVEMREKLFNACLVMECDCDKCPLLTKNGCPIDTSMEVLKELSLKEMKN